MPSSPRFLRRTAPDDPPQLVNVLFVERPFLGLRTRRSRERRTVPVRSVA